MNLGVKDEPPLMLASRRTRLRFGGGSEGWGLAAALRGAAWGCWMRERVPGRRCDGGVKGAGFSAAHILVNPGSPGS